MQPGQSGPSECPVETDEMREIRKSAERGEGGAAWLDSKHSFSFANYFDRNHMGFRSLRVINEDTVSPGGGFGSHPHRDMEIISYVLGGALEHRDNLGNGSVIRPGEVQRMSAGTGIVHSEYNPSGSEPLHFFQIWIEPSQPGLEPGYEQKTIDPNQSSGRLLLIASPEGGGDAVVIHQDARIYSARLAAGDKASHSLKAGRHAWLQLAKGAVTLNGAALHDSDGAAVSDETELEIHAERETELLLFDLA